MRRLLFVCVVCFVGYLLVLFCGFYLVVLDYRFCFTLKRRNGNCFGKFSLMQVDR